ncbi:Integrin-like protein [Candidatus Koribacter versatilis Ellin345]|uniref:Integrin-like protein n=1 Tax=Koribacter versatilis (strain Ellin345) TaxID=204669 RepID=Q1IMB9_KORVE|nr:FG-GAP-like repeat-containing protein [Candidatus Koribacter versatilis]ABF41981.1 Integrin-like protein [Candidatus Koribacter versatilis Ellin345]
MRQVAAVSFFLVFTAVFSAYSQDLTQAKRTPAASGSTQPNVFLTPKQYPAGPSGVTSIAKGDFNNDSYMDVAVTNVSGTITVLLGKGDGTFQAPVSYPALSSPVSIAAADLNGDGKLDLAVANSGSGSISVFLGNGDGTFQSHTDVAVGTSVQMLTVADFNGDGKPDLAVLVDGMVSVLIGKGDATFNAIGEYAKPCATYLATGDFNGDGKTDIVAGRQCVLLGNGDGTFQPPVGSQKIGNTVSTAVGDINGDGKLDLIEGGIGDSDGTPRALVVVLLGNGDGTFQPPQGFFGYGSGVQGLLLADVNGDSHPDIVLSSSENVEVVNGKGDGTFEPGVLYPVGNRPVAGGLVLSDFTGSGRLDLAVLTSCANPSICGDGAVTLLRGKGDGTYVAPASYYIFEGDERFDAVGGWVAVGDFDGDGKLDVLEVFDTRAFISLGNGDGTVQTGQRYYQVAYQSDGAVVGDFNGDGKLDAAILHSCDVFYSDPGPGNPPPYCVSAGSVGVLLGNGNGTWQRWPESLYFGVGDTPTSIATGDFNQDGKLDLVVSDGANAYILLGNGDGTFPVHQAYPTGAAADYLNPFLPNAQSVVVGDFNGDGAPDVAVSNSDGGIAVLLGNGDGTLRAPQLFPAIKSSQSLAIGDLNRDGKLDIVASDGSGSISIFLGNGDGTFQTSKVYAAVGSQSVTVGDFNGDGILDVASGTGHTVSLLLGNGDGSLQPPVNYIVGLSATGLAAGDFNGDGALDLVTEDFSILLNRQGTQLNVQSSRNPSNVGQPVTFTVTSAASLPETGLPSGTITLRDGSTVLGESGVSGVFDVKVSGLTAGTHQITATYSGDNNFQPHTTAILTEHVGAPATMISPALGSILTSTTVTFAWKAAAGASQYSLYLGTKPGRDDLGYVNAHSSTSATVKNLPSTGSSLYVTLFSLVGGVYYSNSYTYILPGTPAKAKMTSPLPGTMLVGKDATFTWSHGTGVTYYSLYVGTKGYGTHDLDFINATTTSASVSNLPADGSTIYVQVNSYIDGAWTSQSYTYISGSGTPAPATMISPTPGSSISGNSATFTWTSGVGVSEFSLYVGTGGVGSHNIAFIETGTTSATVTGLPATGATIYVRLNSFVNGAWQWVDYSYRNP